MKIHERKQKSFSWMHNVLSTKITPFGMGTFAKRKIKKDTLLMIFGGYILTREEENTLPEKIQDIAIQIDRNFVIGLTSIRQLSSADYVNHNCNPNSGIKGQISLHAMRDISAGEEITFDYGTVLFGIKEKPTYKLKCECKSKNCRILITDHDWKKTDLQKKYQGFLPYYVMEAIKRIKYD